MIQKIILGYKNLFFGAGKLLLLLLVCTAAGALVVLPLWKFATASPKAYSVFVLAISAAAVVFLTVRRIRRAGIASFAKSLLKFAIVAGGLFVCIILVFSGKRFLALPMLLAMIFLYGLVAFKK